MVSSFRTDQACLGPPQPWSFDASLRAASSAITVDVPISDMPVRGTRVTESPLGDGRNETRAARATYLGHVAERDEFEPLEAKIRTAGREVTFHAYPGTGHWFVEPNRPEHDAAAALVWERSLAFLRARLG